MTKLSYRTIMISTLAVLIAGIALLTTIDPDTSRLVITLDMILVGLGIGASFSVITNAAIHSLQARQRGAATSTVNFLRSMGMMLGITIFGIFQSHTLTSRLTEAFSGSGPDALPKGFDLNDPYALMNPVTRAAISENSLNSLVGGLSSSISEVFVWGLIPAILSFAAACYMRREKYDPKAEMEAFAATASAH